jgi:hypothetical protein
MAAASMRPLVAALLLSLSLAPISVAAGEPAARAIHLVEGRVLLATPAALPTGMATGVEVTFTRTLTRWLAWGVRVSWATATEYSTDYAVGWEVRHDDLRARGLFLLQRVLGRATLALRLGVGVTLVHQGLTQRPAPVTGGRSLPEDEGWRVLPSIELEPAVTLRLLGGWGVSLGGGPALHVLDGSARWGWTSGLGVAWQR